MRDATKRPIADPNPHVVNSFAWNPEGILARWTGPVPTTDGQHILYEWHWAHLQSSVDGLRERLGGSGGLCAYTDQFLDE